MTARVTSGVRDGGPHCGESGTVDVLGHGLDSAPFQADVRGRRLLPGRE
ncbi:hypothetical protein ACFU9X_12690 [Streptomyces atratus]